MSFYERDPRLVLHTATSAAFQLVATDLETGRDATYIPLQGVAPIDFTDLESTYMADCAAVNAIELHQGNFIINILLTRNNRPYARPADNNGPYSSVVSSFENFQPHVLVVAQDAPAVLTHLSYYDNIHDEPNKLPSLVAAGYAEQIGKARALSLVHCLGSINIKNLNRAEFDAI
jgi:hypothetical protein